MAQAGDWQRDVLRELGRQDSAAGGDETRPAPPQPPTRRAEPTLRLVRSAPPEPSEGRGRQEEAGAGGAPEGVEPLGGPEGAGPGAGSQGAGSQGAGPVEVARMAEDGPFAGSAPDQRAPVEQPPGQPVPGAQPPGRGVPGVQLPVQATPFAQPPVGPMSGVGTAGSYVPGGVPQVGGAVVASGADGDGQTGAGGHSPAPSTTPANSPAPTPSATPAPPAPRDPRMPQIPLHAPDSVPTIDPRLAHALGRPQHGESVARRTGRSIRKLTGSAAQDVAEETRIARELQQPVTTGRVVAVTSIRGGVGKSTIAALLGRTFNHYRHDPVLTLEADAALGTLPVRMGADSVRWAAADLARILNPAMQLTDVTGYLVPVSDGGWLLPASQGRVGAPLDIRTYRTVTLALRRYFAVTVVDCETLPGEVARTAMDTAHARVVVAPMTAEGVNGTRQVLDWLGQLPHSALSSTVVALTAGSPDVTLDRATAVAHLKESGVHVVTVPYDRHLAQGGPIRTALLGQETRAAAITLAAEAMTRAVRMR
ncbi:hypothetical protein IHE70_08360 [Streptomyces sp. ID-01-6.2a]|uniref:MinD-like ATPase involved in chromosome partitioning or flagellar assembly n=2 Tax=Streptomyces caniscabiei TaxID=2746961 RepID=A0A927KZI0_9ACTN|nr:hypothetical protein [Streptomyces caniscabiei]